MNHHVPGHPISASPAGQGKSGCLRPRLPRSRPARGHHPRPAQGGRRPRIPPHEPGSPSPAAHYRLTSGRVKGASGAAARALRAP